MVEWDQSNLILRMEELNTQKERTILNQFPPNPETDQMDQKCKTAKSTGIREVI